MLSVSISPLSPAWSVGPVPRFQGPSILASAPSGAGDPVLDSAPAVHRSQSANAVTATQTSRAATPAATYSATVDPSNASAHAASTSASSSSNSPSGSSGKSSSVTTASPAAVAAAVEQQELMDSFSTTVRGKQYAGSVVEAAGEYTASVATVVGASATGAILQTAETNLDTRIDELV